MTERFTLAANVLLSRRLKNLLRIDENVEIDMSYITCAEYQLFIDEKLKADEHRQPDHWTSYRFPHGDAKKSITGVRFSDGEEFCKWLTQQQSTLGRKYRLPTLAEVEEYPVTEKQVGCWCFDGEQRIIAGIETGQKQIWQQNLAEVLDINCDLYGNLYHVLSRVLSRFLNLLDLDLNGFLNHDLNRFLNRDLYRDFYYHLYPNLYRDVYPDLYSDLNRFLYHHLNRDLYPDLYPDLYRDLNCLLNRDLNLDLNPDLKRVLNRDPYSDLNHVLNRDFYRVLENKLKVIEAGKASDFLLLYFSLIPIIVLSIFLAATYQIISQNQAVLNIIKLSAQEGEFIRNKYLNNFNKIYPLCVYLVLLDERQAGRMPAWESIRIVRERVE